MEVIKLNIIEQPYEFYRPISTTPCVLCLFNGVTKGLVLSVDGDRIKLAVCDKCAQMDIELIGKILTDSPWRIMARGILNQRGGGL